MENNNDLPLIKPRIRPPLDPYFRPACLANRAFRKHVSKTGEGVPVSLALERHPGSISRFATTIFPINHPESKGNFIYLERLLKCLLWSRGGSKLYIAGPINLIRRLQAHYTQTTAGIFDADMMGKKIYHHPFTIIPAAADELPAACEPAAALGRHLDGCRIGFDLGASDRKAAAIIDGECIHSEEIPWFPALEKDPQWHFDQIMDSLKKAAAHLPHVDAIGGSAAGVYVKNQVRVASLFRGVPDAVFKEQIGPLFHNLKKAWNDIPFEVVNDGEVTALAGAMALNRNGILGIAMGSSLAGGYVTQEGTITDWLNELCFVPVDYHPAAAIDEWSGDYGCGVRYFSQQAVGRLIPKSGLEIETTLPLPEQLNKVQQAMAAGDERAAAIYHTIGVYLGYTLAHYAEFYDFNYLLVLGRVMTGAGGDLIIDHARQILNDEFPELAQKIHFHFPDEKEKRHGQAIAAASLPVI